MKRLIQQFVICVLGLGIVLTFNHVAFAEVSAAAVSQSSSVIQGSTRYKKCVVKSVKRIGDDGRNAKVEFKDSNNVSHTAIVPWDSSLRRKLQRAARTGRKVNITVNDNGQITQVN